MINYRYENYTELDQVYACEAFPLATLFSDSTIDLYRALKLDFDLVPPSMPTQLDVLLSIILYTKHFDSFYSLIVNMIEEYDFQGSLNYEVEYLHILDGSRESLVKLILTMKNPHRVYINNLPNLVAEVLYGLQ
jgi:hypothetical protein